MLAIPVFSMNGERSGEIEVDPAVLGGRIRPGLMKQAIVAFLEHQRQYSARTKGRSQVAGSTRKLYRQKGTGNARVGNIRTPVRRGGGRAFAKRVPSTHVAMPKKMRRLARNSAVLAKIKADEVLVVDDLKFDQPRTRDFAAMLRSLSADNGAVVAINEHDANVVLSGRNLPRIEIRLVDQLNTYEILRRRKLIFSRPAFDRFVGDPFTMRGADENRA